MAKKKQITVEQIDARIARWQTRLKRALYTIERLQRMRKRALKKVPGKIRGETATMVIVDDQFKPAAESAGSAVAPPPPPAAPVDDGIPAFLRRAKLDPVAEQIVAELAETKRLKARGRIAKMKAKQSGETRRMPLTGKAALAAIRNA